MDIHERYKNLPTWNISILEVTNTLFNEKPLEVIHRLVQYYNNEITKHGLDIKILETFRMILCYEYQLFVNSNENCIPSNLKDVCFADIKSIVFPEKKSCNNLEMTILYDIIILQLVLYCDISQIRYHLENFKKYMNMSNTNNHDTKITQCFLEAISLYSFLYKNIKQDELQKLSILYLKEIELWLQANENIQWRSLALILPKLIETFKVENMLNPIWNILFSQLTNLKDILVALSVMVDTFFPLELQNTAEIYMDLCINDTLWTSIAKGLTSSTQQFRKQALFLMRRVTDFAEKAHISDKISLSSIAPFIHCKKKESITSIDSMKQYYFLILEALEEKQNHLVTPALSHIPTLIKGHQEHISCNNCFAIRWVRCMFERILQHESNVIVKRGLFDACKMDLDLYNEEFLSIFIKVLNNTYLYECQNDESTPQIVNELADLFQRVTEMRLQKKFLFRISEETWGPVALFNVLQALQLSSSKTTEFAKWEADEMNVVKTLISKNLNMHSRVLRIASQTEILRTICNSVKEVRDLSLLASTLALFPAEEALARKTYPWNLVTAWLTNVLSNDSIAGFVNVTCKTYLLENTVHNAVSPNTFAFMILLLHDAKLILQSKNCPTERELHSWLRSLIGADVRPYASIISGLEVTEFISDLIKLCKNDRSKNIYRLVAPYIEHALKFLMKNLRKAAQTLTYDDLNRYLTVIEIMFNKDHDFISEREKFHYAGKFQDESIEILQNMNSQIVHYLCGLRILHLCQNLIPPSTAKCLFTQPVLNIGFDSTKQDDVTIKGKIMSDYCVFRAKLSLQYITEVPAESWPSDINWLENTTELFEIGGHEILPIITAILKALVNKKKIESLKDMESLKNIFKVCWNCTFLNKKNNIFWQAIQGLLGIIVNSNFFTLPEATTFAHQYLDKLLEEADGMPNLKRILLKEMEMLDVGTLKIFQEALLECLLHGHASRRDKRIENQVRLYIVDNFKEYFPQFMSMTDCNTDATIRAHSAILLHRAITADVEFASTFLPLVLSRLEKIKNKRYFNHSYLHKVKHRIMQVLLILEPVLTKPSLNLLQETICNLLLLESNQHSVRLMQEWLLTRIFLNNEDLHNKLWDFFEESIAQRPGCTSSIASIIYHTALLLPNKIRPSFIHRSLPYISQCCLGQQFNIRLHNQFVLVKLFELVPESSVQDIEEYKGLYNAAIQSLKQGNLLKNSLKLQDDFYFSVFHPIMDYNMQTIYFELPRLSNLDLDELITPILFETLNYTEADDIHPLKLFNADSLLAEATIPSHFMKSNPGIEISQENDEINHGGLSDIQRKINPWKTIIPDYDEIYENQNQFSQATTPYQEDEGIIVVASLIDRPPNLGGLARTCEIFGVRKLVISNLNYVKDMEFQTLSVSAEKWLTIIEVKPRQLKEFLLTKKDLGWSLVGIEQTANSTSLLQMKFEKKTILVLGNEKDGIPANLIPLVDTCVEVPQVGLVRSLNVHVTGAICIWQYANQHIFP